MRGVRTILLGACLALVASSCTSDDGGGSSAADDTGAPSPGTEAPVGSDSGNGFADAEWFTDRQDDFLEFATEELDPNSILNVLNHAERADRDPDFEWEAEAVTPETFAEPLEKITGWIDTSDFDALYLVNLLYGYEDQLSEELVEAVDDALLGFEYWFTEPTPKGVVDQKYYWSENHRIIFHTLEYLVGQRHPEATFRNDRRTGTEHQAEAKERILRWLDEKADVGFTEWHSDVYYQKDVTPLLTLVEWADDDEIRTKAAAMLDLFLFDIALHLHHGNLGATHGRSYMKDKSKAPDQDVFGLAKLLFEDTRLPYVSTSDAGASLLARAKRYRLPEVIRRVAASDEPMVDRERMSVPLDLAAPVTDEPEPPYGYSFDDPDNVGFWWERAAQPAWQLAPLTVSTVDEYDLWDTPTFAPFQQIRDLVGDDIRAGQELLQSLAPFLSFAVLGESNTVTYRTGDVMLSTVQDFRPGTYSDQHHVWQATLDEDAIVFTTLPKNEPFEGEQSWPDADGYWTGSGSLPRSAQHGATSISLYAPTTPHEGPLPGFERLDYTHAWFPTERFDEVVRDGRWTFGRAGDGYVGLWSWRRPGWREHDPAEVFTDGLTEPFDLVAPDGPDNVWIAQVGDASEGSFEDFQAALRSSEVSVDRRRPTPDGFHGGFDVAFASPTEGEMRFGQDGPLLVDGDRVPLRHELRYDNPWAQVPFRSHTFEISDGEVSLALDFDAGTRTVSAD